MSDFAIGIPTINRYDLLQPSLLNYLLLDFPNTKIYLLDNGNQNIRDFHKNLTILTCSRNLGVSASWNLLSNLIFNESNSSHCLLLNDDIYFGKKESDIYKLLETEYDFYVSNHNWSAFILPKKTFDIIGGFDSNFYPAYFEDNDFHYRMKLKNLTYHQTEKLNVEVFRNSMTIKKDPSLNKNFEKNREYYINKWGGEPGKEIYKTPFNK